MLRRETKYTALAALLFCLLAAQSSSAFEPTTHPGLTAQAVMQSTLPRVLRESLGQPLGLFVTLRIDPELLGHQRYASLSNDLERLNPADGIRPDSAGRQHALNWIMAGSVLAEMPASLDRHHFYAPPLRAGLDNAKPLTGEVVSLLSVIEGGDSLREFLTGTGFDLTGQSALQWLTAVDNPGSLATFYSALAAAVASATPRERSHSLALAMMSLGELLHLLQDMASPTHTRNDFLPGHLERLSASTFDRGSAFERMVALTYGSLGLPAYRGEPIRRSRLLHYFSSPRWDGLADISSVNHFSPGTVPHPLIVFPESKASALRQQLAAELRFAAPGLAPLDVPCARQGVCYQTGRFGPQLAYRVDADQRLVFFLDRACYEAAARHLLPLAVGFSTGFIEHLFRGRLSLEREGEQLVLRNQGPALVAAHARLLWDHGQGRRTLLQQADLRGPAQPGAVLATLRANAPANRGQLVVLLEGRDVHGDPLVAAAALPLK